MYQQKSRRCCALMLTVSICLRLCMFLGLDARAAAFLAKTAQNPTVVRFLLYLETGQAAPAESAAPVEPPAIVLHYLEPEPAVPECSPAPAPEPPAEEETEEVPPLQTVAAEELTVAGGCTYPIDQAALLAQPSSLRLDGNAPQILIVHTHGSEAYTPQAGWEYDALTAYRTLEPDRSVIAVGEALAKTLEAHGISVLHDRTIHDYPSYNTSYASALQTIDAHLAQYPQIQMVLDIHRDAVEDPLGQAVALSSTQDGASAAQLMLVVGTDQGGLSHPHWQENLANALKLQSVLEGSYPGLCRNLDLRTERFNQHATKGSLLIEVGTNGNTLEQALHSAQLLGDGLARMLHALTQNNGVLQVDP